MEVPLGVPHTLQRHDPPWCVLRVTNPEHVSLKDKEMQIKLLKNCNGIESGAAVRAVPKALKWPYSKTLKVSYEVYLPENLKGLKGGKLPGVSLGTDPGDSATGGDWQSRAGSCRVMFRDSFAVGYIYPAIPGGTEGAWKAQTDSYRAVAKHQGAFGHELWGKIAGWPLKFKYDAWNAVEMTVGLNTPGKSDGFLELSVNGVTRKVPVRWRDSPTVGISDLNVVAFLGGNSTDWNSPKDSYVKFRNFTLRC